jgi:RNA polymerase sigma factor (sigma-70 family)
LASEAQDASLPDGVEDAIRRAINIYARWPLPAYMSYDDLTQDIRLQILKMLPRARGHVDDVGGWAHMVAANVIRMCYRREARRRSLCMIEAIDYSDESSSVLLAPTTYHPGDFTSRPARWPDIIDAKTIVPKLLQTLPDRWRLVVVLRIALDYSGDEVAALMGCNPMWVHKMKCYALKRLRERLASRQETVAGRRV